MSACRAQRVRCRVPQCRKDAPESAGYDDCLRARRRLSTMRARFGARLVPDARHAARPRQKIGFNAAAFDDAYRVTFAARAALDMPLSTTLSDA